MTVQGGFNSVEPSALAARRMVDHPDVAAHVHEVKDQNIRRKGDLKVFAEKRSRRLPVPVKVIHRQRRPDRLFRVWR